jgi:2-polyprenyl-3-methyl-5-hydroxy-6-metoxy-1,4-benzoquinol methylase
MSNYSNSDFKDDSNTSWSKTLSLIPDKTLVLDIGCSSGTFGEELIKKKGCIVDGIELDDGDIAKARKKLRNVYKFDIERDALELDQTYDVIFIGDVVEHLARPVKALERIKKLLKDEGILVFSIPNITHMYVRLMLLSGNIEYGRTGLLDETHLHFYNSKEIYRVFNGAGYIIDTFDHTINDMPYALVKKQLHQLGLEPTKDFKKLLESVDAVAYQFMGVAKKGKIKKQPLPKTSPRNIIGDYIKEMQHQYEDAIKELQEDRQKVIEDRVRILLDRDRIQQELGNSGRYQRVIKRRLRTVAKKIRRSN